MPGPKRLDKGGTLAGLPVDSWNAFVDTTEKFALLQRGGAGDGQSAGAQRLTVIAENTTGSLINSDFPVLEIDGPVYNVTDRVGVVFEGISLRGKTPTSTATMADIIICQGPIGDSGSDAFRQSAIIGPTWCDVSVTNDSHTHATVKVGDNTQLLSSAGDGVPIIWKQSGTGKKKALVILGLSPGGAKLRIGKTRAEGITARSSLTLGSGIVDWYTSVNRPLIAETGTNDTVYNIARNPVAGNTFIIAAQDEDGTWLVIVEDCA